MDINEFSPKNGGLPNIAYIPIIIGIAAFLISMLSSVDKVMAGHTNFKIQFVGYLVTAFFITMGCSWRHLKKLRKPNNFALATLGIYVFAWWAWAVTQSTATYFRYHHEEQTIEKCFQMDGGIYIPLNIIFDIEPRFTCVLPNGEAFNINISTSINEKE